MRKSAAMQSERLRGWIGRLDEVDLPRLLRPAFVVAQAASILITWPLWQARADPPPLPVLEGLPQVDMGLVLLATLALVLFKPEAGVIAHSVALVVAFAMDQTRIQPEFVSLALILWGTTSFRYARVVAAAHLVTLWLWAGLNKALSLDFMDQSAEFLFNSFPVRPEFLRPAFGWIIIVCEISIGLLLLTKRWRRAGIALAIGLHVLGLVALVNVRWNEAVWPWNVALALAAVAFFWARSEEPALPRALPIFAAFALIPLGFYVGVVDAYLAHNLYTSNTASAAICETDTSCSLDAWSDVLTTLNVPFPPEPRLYRAYFDEVCAPGQTLMIAPRRTRILVGLNTRLSVYPCPSAAA
jgi:hypothetical protein